VEIGDTEIRITASDVDVPGLQLHTPVIFRHMEHFHPTAEARGTEADRETVIALVRGSMQR
jgi:3',5'-cyclic-AMP phosphodiesterase